jgi:hypothetical protein
LPFKRNVQRYITGKGKRLLCYDPRSPTDITEYVRETSRFDDFSVVRLHQSPNDDNLVVRKRGGMGWDGMGWDGGDTDTLWFHNPLPFVEKNKHVTCVIDPRGTTGAGFISPHSLRASHFSTNSSNDSNSTWSTRFICVTTSRWASPRE